MERPELEQTHIENYKLGAKYCRYLMGKRGMSILV
jgi:hypothetical protein